MPARNAKPLLARIGPDKFVGRQDELERLYLRAVSGSGSAGLNVVGPAGAGTSELLRQLYDMLFAEQRFVVPFYFSVRADDLNAHAAAARYLYQFILQSIAFRRREPELISASPDICELSKLAPVTDAEWVDRMCEVCRNEGPLNDERAFIRTALNAPFRAAAAAGMRVWAIVDDLHEASVLIDGGVLVSELSPIASRPSTQLLTGHRRNFAVPFSAAESLEVEFLGRDHLQQLIDLLALDRDVEISDETRDLIAVQLGGRPGLINQFVGSTRAKGRSLLSYRDVQQLYTDELINGRLGVHFDAVLSRAVPDAAMRQKLVDTLYFSIANEDQRFQVDALREKLGVGRDEIAGIARSLQLDEVLDLETGIARVASDELFRDFLAARHRGTARQRTPGAIAALTVTSALKRAPKLMSRVYRQQTSLRLADLLLAFDIQEVPRALIDYRTFRENFKGLPENAVKSKLLTETETVLIPQISHAAPVIEHYPAFDHAEPERAVVGVGFIDRGYRDQDEVAWFAAEIDSKLEADAGLTLEWCDRLDAAAAELGYSKHRIWLVSPEGFSEGALDILAERNGYGSSRRQAELLRDFLRSGDAQAGPNAAEYEVVIPIGDETELIAAHALEEIARKYNIPAKTTNQIKTALVEACINAAEHGLSPDGKIRQKFVIDGEKIVVTISNRGLRLTERAVQNATETLNPEGRRGWGLGLIRTLMDDVRVESVDDGTRIVMTKNLLPAK